MRALAVLASVSAVVVLAVVGGGATNAAAAAQKVTVQNAVLVSPYSLTVTGTSTCTGVIVYMASATEQNGASGSGGGTFSGTSSNWSVEIDNTSAIAFVKGKATISVSTSCGDDTRTIAVNTT